MAGAADRFHGKVALVTGAASGIGLSTVAALAREGAAVMLADRDEAGLSRALARLEADGARAAASCGDVSREADCLAFVRATVAAFGGLDVAINNAGVIGAPCPVFEEASVAEWDRQLAVNLTGTFLSMRAEVPALKARGGGAIVNTISLAGLLAARGMPGYIASKHGVTGLTKAAALDLVDSGIRVNAVCPGIIDTPLLSSASADPAMAAALTALVPLGRMGRAEEVARTILFLASDEAPYLVGACVAMDGGISLS